MSDQENKDQRLRDWLNNWGDLDSPKYANAPELCKVGYRDALADIAEFLRARLAPGKEP